MSRLLQRIIRKPGQLRRMGDSAAGKGEKWVVDDSPNPLFSLKSIGIIVGITTTCYYLRELRKDENNFITAWMRNKMEQNCRDSWKAQVDHMYATQQRMYEYIEKKKFPQYPLLPSYGKMFNHPRADLGNPKSKLPGGFDD